MGKAIVSIFFVLGFIVFSLIKFATKGVKEAYRVVNEEPKQHEPHYIPSIKKLENDNLNKSYMVAMRLLSPQLALCSEVYGMLPDKAKDNWSLGYIGGVSDAILERDGVNDDISILEITNTVFITLLGNEQGFIYFQKFIDLLQAKDQDLLNGIEKGGGEVFAWLSDKNKAPMGWAAHAHGYIDFKLATKGVKEDHRAVNDEHSKELTHSKGEIYAHSKNTIDCIVGSLKGQKTLASDIYGMLPDKAKDNWSLGYIYGYSDAFIKNTGKNIGANRSEIFSIVLMMIFGEEQGIIYFKKFIDLQQLNDNDLLDGIKKGNDEVVVWLGDTGDKSPTPMGWAGHAHGYMDFNNTK